MSACEEIQAVLDTSNLTKLLTHTPRPSIASDRQTTLEFTDVPESSFGESVSAEKSDDEDSKRKDLISSHLPVILNSLSLSFSRHFFEKQKSYR